MGNKPGFKKQVAWEILLLFNIKSEWTANEIVERMEELRDKWSFHTNGKKRRKNDDIALIKAMLWNSELLTENAIKVVDIDITNRSSRIFAKGENFEKELLKIGRKLASVLDEFLTVDDTYEPAVIECTDSEDIILSGRALESLVELIWSCA